MVNSATLRRVDMLPPVELSHSILQVVERSIGIAERDLAIEVARAFGFKSTSADMRTCVTDNARRLVTEGRLSIEGSEYRLP